MENQATQEKQEKTKTRLRFLLLLLILLIAIGVSVWALFFRTVPTLAPDYAPQQEEKYAQDIGDNGKEKLDQAKGGGAVSLTYSTKVDIDLSKKQATIMFQNPSESNQSMVVQLVVQDTVIAQSGKLSPGKKTEKIDLLENAVGQLQPGGYEGKFIVLYYQPDTGEKTVVNTEIPVNITVKE